MLGYLLRQYNICTVLISCKLILSPCVPVASSLCTICLTTFGLSCSALLCIAMTQKSFVFFFSLFHPTVGLKFQHNCFHPPVAVTSPFPFCMLWKNDLHVCYKLFFYEYNKNITTETRVAVFLIVKIRTSKLNHHVAKSKVSVEMTLLGNSLRPSLDLSPPTTPTPPILTVNMQLKTLNMFSLLDIQIFQ